MSYSSRVYRQRNAHTNDEKKDQTPFFGPADKQSKPGKKSKAFFQPKLKIGQPNDKYEKEADAVASSVVNQQQGGAPVVQQKEISSIQRLATSSEEEKLGTNEERMKKDKEVQEKPDLQAKCAECEQEEKDKAVQQLEDPEKKKDEKKGGSVQKKDDPEKEKKDKSSIQKMEDPEKEKKDKTSIQKKDDPEKEKDKKDKSSIQKMEDPEKEKKDKASIQKMEDPEKEKDKRKGEGTLQQKPAEGRSAGAGLSSKLEQSSGKGESLPSKTLQRMEQSFGKDFSEVNVHRGEEAANLNKELGAQAFTHGGDIYFNEGKYDPDSTKGQELLAHELTHVVQQGASTDKAAEGKTNTGGQSK